VRRPTNLQLLLVACGIVMAILGGWRLDRDIHHAALGVNQERAGGIADSLVMQREGGPPLLGFTQNGGYYPVGTDDDRGSYLYLSFLGRTLGIDDPNVLLKWFFIAIFIPTFLFYPLVFFELFGSILAAVVAPLLLIFEFGFLKNTGVYWPPAWAALSLLPLVLLAYKRWGPRSIWWLTGIMVAASFASSIRSGGGVPVVIAGIAVVLARVKPWRTRGAYVLLLLVAYLSISTFTMHAVQKQRDAVVGTDLTSPYPNGHVFWHSAYIGLGYLANPYGLRYDDNVAVAHARREDPTAVFPTKKYESTVRRLYVNFVLDHPGFVLRTYASKAAVILRRAFEQLPLVFVLLPFALIASRWRRTMLEYVLLAAPAVLLSSVSLILTVPYHELDVGWLAAWGLLWLLVAGWLAALLEEAWRSGAVRQAGLGTIRDRFLPILYRGRRRLAAATIAAAVVGALGAAVAAAGRPIETKALYRDSQTPLVPAASLHDPAIHTWRFDRSKPSGWLVAGSDVRLSKASRGTRVTTSRPKYAYQLASPVVDLPPAEYRVVVDARVVGGGLALVIVDAGKDETIVESVHSSDQTGYDDKRIVATFELARPTAVRVVLANFGLTGKPSSWVVHSVRVTKPPNQTCELRLPQPWFSSAR
jgi:hypothetical protein